MELEQIANKAAAYFTGRPVIRAYVFGSWSKGEQTPTSDIDILVELDYDKGGASFDNWCEMQDDLSALLHSKVDLVSANGLSKFIAPYIHSSKKLIYERSQRSAAA
jgi:predicted nucleotidyltransferase